MTKKDQFTILFLSLYASVLITSVSFCSPLYGFNDMVDINIIFSVGKSFWRGKLVYRDLFEHKGPLMYAITAIASLISFSNLHGVWILEIVSAVLFAIFSFLILKKLKPEASGILLSPILYLIYHSGSFAGGTAEEFCLPLLAGSLLAGINAMEKKRMPSFRESFWIGITSAIMFWIKYNMIGFYVGLFIAFVIFALKDKTLKQLGTAILGVACGVLTVSIPILIFFGMQSALDDLFQVYFYDNVHNYANRLDFLYQGYYALIGTLNTIRNNLAAWALIAVGILWLLIRHKNKRILVLVICSAFFTAWFVYCGGMQFPYYGFILLLFAVLAAAIEPKLPYGRVLAPLCAAGFALFTFPFSKLSCPDNPDSYVQYRLTRQIDPSATLLTYNSFDQGFYTAGSLYPSEYHFCMTNCMIDDANAAQLQYIEEGRTEYIVTREDLSMYSNYALLTEDGEWKLYQRAD